MLAPFNRFFKYPTVKRHDNFGLFQIQFCLTPKDGRQFPLGIQLFPLWSGQSHLILDCLQTLKALQVSLLCLVKFGPGHNLFTGKFF